MKKVLLVLPEEMHYTLKVRAAEQRTTLRGFCLEAIKTALERGGAREKK